MIRTTSLNGAGIEIVQLDKEDLDNLARKTTILINCVGPYHKYSTPVVAACASNGTHYLDVTGETPWVLEIVTKYHQTAVESKAIIIPEIGLESAPSDLLAYLVVSKIKALYSALTGSVICSVHKIKSAGPSGGTLDTILSIRNKYSLSHLRKSLSPFSLSPTPPKTIPRSPKSVFGKLFGPFQVPHLGILTTAITGRANAAIVNRSAALMPDTYGSGFQYSEFQRVPSRLVGAGIHFALGLFTVCLMISPLRWLARKFVYAPGSGPERSTHQSEEFELRALGSADKKPGQVLGRFSYKGGIYYMTGVLMAEAAMVLLKDKSLVQKLGGGILTPAMLGDGFIERLRNVGFEIEVQGL